MINNGEKKRINYAVEVFERISGILHDKAGCDVPPAIVISIFEQHCTNERGYRQGIANGSTVPDPDDTKFGDEEHAVEFKTADTIIGESTAGTGDGVKSGPSQVAESGTDTKSGVSRTEAGTSGPAVPPKKSEGYPATKPGSRDPGPQQRFIYVNYKLREGGEELVGAFLDANGKKAIEELTFAECKTLIKQLKTLKEF